MALSSFGFGSYMNSYVRALDNLRNGYAGLEDDDDRYNYLDYFGLYKTVALHAVQFIGICDAIDIISLPHDLRKEFKVRCLSLFRILNEVDGAFWEVDDDAIREIKILAEFCRANIGCVALLPSSMICFFSRIFICAGALDLYFHYRRVYVEKLRANADAYMASDCYEAHVYQVALANELQDTNFFIDSCAKIRRKFRHLDESFFSFLSYSRLYYNSFGFDGPVPDDSFAKYLSGKAIAVVGPVDAGLNNGAEIDEFDVVIRFNHRSSNAFDLLKFGSRTDVSFYLYDDLARWPSENFINVMSDLKFIVLSEQCIDAYTWLHPFKEKLQKRLEVFNYKINPFLLGYANAVQRALMDILRLPIKKIKIFNVDMYLGGAYGGGYLLDKVNQHMLSPGFTLHDPVSNFIFTKRMYESGRIEVDEVLMSILLKSQAEYEAAFLDQYGLETI